MTRAVNVRQVFVAEDRVLAAAARYRLMTGTRSATSLRLRYFAIALVAMSCTNAPAADAEPVIRFPANTLDLRNQLITITPPGMPAKQVSTFLETEMRAHGEADQSVIDANTQLRRGPALIPNPNAEVRGWHYAPVGVKHITAVFRWPSLGFILVMPVATKNAVEVSYAFDNEDRLLDIGVTKWVEGLP